MSEFGRKKVTFPLERSRATEVTVEEMKQRNPHDIYVNFRSNPERNIPRPWNEDFRDVGNKSARLSRAWDRFAVKYNLCLFCYGQTIGYLNSINWPFLNCSKCANDIWDGNCLACGRIGEEWSGIFCFDCMNGIDDKEVVALGKAFVEQNKIPAVERPKLIRHARRCCLCELSVPGDAGIFCPEHEKLFRNFQRYSRQLEIERRCKWCEGDLPNDDPVGDTQSHICESCFQAGFDTCVSCQEPFERFYNGVEMTTRFSVCIRCVEKRCKIVEGWKSSESSGERALLKILTELFPGDQIYQRLRPTWLGGLELDFFIPDRNLAFEFDGKQHHEFVPLFHQTIEKFHLQIERDLKKDDLCKKLSIRLIRIRYDTELSTKKIQALIETPRSKPGRWRW